MVYSEEEEEEEKTLPIQINIFKKIGIVCFNNKTTLVLMPYNPHFYHPFYAACTCDTLGTEGNRGCDKGTGNCICKRFVTGRNCDRCYVSKISFGEQHVFRL